jgi:AcrR family transcriptional regulator
VSGSESVSEEVRAARIAGESGQRLLAATRRTIARNGIAGSTLGAITTEAGLTGGMVFWVFGGKRRLFAELLAADARERLDGLRAAITPASCIGELLDALAEQVTGFLREELGAHVLLQELGSLALREPEMREAIAERRGQWCRTFAELLEAKADEGVIELAAEPATVATLLTALGHGLAIDVLLGPERDPQPIIDSARTWVRELLAPTDEERGGGVAVAPGPRFRT